LIKIGPRYQVKKKIEEHEKKIGVQFANKKSVGG